MKSWRLQNNCKVFQLLAGRSNVYLVEAENKTILIDTSTQANRQKLIKRFSELKCAKKEIDLLILTHIHFDHCSNAAYLIKKFACKIIMSQHEITFAKNGLTPIPQGTNPFSRLVSGLGNRFLVHKPQFEIFEPDILFDGKNQLEELPDGVKILPTPGHSAGSLSVIVNNELALVGDTLFGVFRNSAFPPFSDNIPVMLESWKLLLNTKCTIFLPGHGSPIDRSIVEKELNRYTKKYNNPKTNIKENA